MDTTALSRFIEQFGEQFPDAKKDPDMLGVSVSFSTVGEPNLSLSVRESKMEDFLRRHELPESFLMETQGVAQLVVLKIVARPVLAPLKSARRFSV